LPQYSSSDQSYGGYAFHQLTRSLHQAKANKTHRTGSELSRLFGVTPKAIRDVWNLRSWTLATKPHWSEHDRQQYEDSLNNARGCAASSAPSQDTSPRGSPTLVGRNPLQTTAAGAYASNVFGKQANMYIASPDTGKSVTGIDRQPHFKRPRHLLSAAMPVSSADINESQKERPPPAKFQRSVQWTSAWSNLVKVSTTSSFEGAKTVLCFIDSSYSRLHLIDDASSTEVLSCPLDIITLRACSGKPDTDTAVVVTLPTSTTAAITLYLRRTVSSQARQSLPPALSLAATSRVPVGILTGTRGELLSRGLTHFLGSRTISDS